MLVVGATVALSVAVPASEPVDPVVVGSVDVPVGSVADDVWAFPVAESSRPPLSPHAAPAIHKIPSENPRHRMRPT
ncbi:hypothetical protein [Nannocystis pusilla]|uniref:hypothetical protein n=1 Tax=Nannocystis pusilla TaxID=889268 RepID=UPI003B8252AA